MGHDPHHSSKKSSHYAARIHKSVPTGLVPANRLGLILEVDLVPCNTKGTGQNGHGEKGKIGNKSGKGL